MFGFQRLDSYQCALKFVSLALPLADAAPRGRGELADQLRRAALSISLNIAEGSGRWERDARRFYDIARGSALECAALVDVMKTTGGWDPERLAEPMELLERIVQMLTRMARR